MLRGSIVCLRALELSDLDILYEVENNTDYWDDGGVLTPFSRDILSRYLKNSHQSIYELKQQRFAIVSVKDELVGFIDLFDFDGHHKRGGVGIVVRKEYQRQGIAKEAISLLKKYAFEHLNLHQLYANILETNKISLKLFSNQGFKFVGVKKDWVLVKGNYVNIVFLQCVK